ncbi:MAG: dihydroneopterin aldolase [Actinomycetota bacterium]|nr:dihydroneopterin aldolase [Actinomycetota bacterium]
MTILGSLAYPDSMTKQGVISIQGLSCFGRHGVLRHEQIVAQEFLIDIDIDMDLGPAIEYDNVDASVDYSKACKIAVEVVEGNSFALIETLAHTIGATLTSEFDSIDRVRVKVRKVAPPMQFHVASVSVTIAVERGI